MISSRSAPPSAHDFSSFIFTVVQLAVTGTAARRRQNFFDRNFERLNAFLINGAASRREKREREQPEACDKREWSTHGGLLTLQITQSRRQFQKRRRTRLEFNYCASLFDFRASAEIVPASASAAKSAMLKTTRRTPAN